MGSSISSQDHAQADGIALERGSALIRILREHFSGRPSQYFAAADAITALFSAKQVAGKVPGMNNKETP